LVRKLIAEPERPTFISYKVARSRLDRLRFVTQDPDRTSGLISMRRVVSHFTRRPVVGCYDLVTYKVWFSPR